GQGPDGAGLVRPDRLGARRYRSSGSGRRRGCGRTHGHGATTMTIRILLAEDENLIRDALASLLDLQEGLAVVTQAASGTEAIAAAIKHRPDVAVLDLQMPGADGIEVAEHLAQEVPECAVVIVTS